MRRTLLAILALAGLCRGADVTVPSQHLDGSGTSITVTELPPDPGSGSTNPTVAASGSWRGSPLAGVGKLNINPDGTWDATFDLKAEGNGVDILPGWKFRLRLKANPADDDGDDQEIGGELQLEGTPWGKGSVLLKH